jgi:hypothetical protein
LRRGGSFLGFLPLLEEAQNTMKYPISALLARFDQDLADDSLRIVLIGSADQIIQTTHQLHSLGFADVNDWSPVLPLPNSTDVFSLLTRSRP